MPQDTGVAYQGSQSVAMQIVNSAGFVENLEPLAFLTSTDKEAKIARFFLANFLSILMDVLIVGSMTTNIHGTVIQ